LENKTGRRMDKKAEIRGETEREKIESDEKEEPLAFQQKT